MANYYSYDERDSSYSYYYGYRANYYDAYDYANSSYTLGTGEAAYGYISSSSDKDYYSLGYLYGSGYQYTVQASGTSWASNTSSGQYNTPDVSIYDASGNLVKSGSGGSVTFKPGSSGYYYVAVSDSSASQYALILSETYKPNYYTPSVSSSYVYLNENSAVGTSVHDVYASDSDGDGITYAIYSGNTDVDGDGNAAFSIRASDGLITVNDAGDLNYESQSSFSLYVSASDGSNTGYGTTKVYLNDVKEGPTLSSYASGVSENSGSGTYAGYVYASGYSGTVTYSITGGNTDVDGDGYLPFYISKYYDGYAYLYVNDADDLNYESQSKFDLKVSATDYSGTATTTTTVSLYNVNEAPVLSGSTLYVNENSSAWTSVGTVSGSDPEGNTLSYSITGGNTDVDGDGSLPFYMTSSGQIYVYDSGDLNYESRSSFALTVKATDSAYNSTTATTTVYLNDVSEGPTLGSHASAVNENSGYGTYAGYVYASSYSGTVSYSITGGNTDVDGDGDLPFYLSNYYNGYAYLYVNDAGDLNYESQTKFDLKVSATDYSGTATTTTTVSLYNVNDAPTGSVTISGTATQGETLTADHSLADADGLGSISYQWLRAGNAISGATASSYQLTASDMGQAISVRASYTDGQGTEESQTSATVTPIALDPGLVFGDATGLVTTEAGGTDSFTVALRAEPRHDVTLTFTISDATEAVFSASGKATYSITFTAADWATAQTVKLRGVDDKPEDGDVAYTISTRVSSSDLRYDGMRSGSGLSIDNLTAKTTDDDAPDEQYGDKGGIAIADLIQGGNGASDLYGLNGRDEMYGNNGDDRLYGGYGDDVLFGNADHDELEGDQGNDKLDGGTGNDGLNGGTGNDSLYGQAGNDNLLGEAGKDLLVGGAGNDTLNGGADADNMDGGNGSDVYYIDNAADVVRDSGTDTVVDTVYIMSYLSGGITLGTGIDNGALNDQAGKGSLTGNTGNNALTGNASENMILGGEGTDTLSGGAGSDTLDGGVGSDTLDGGVGTDSLTGGAGGDSLSGGLGDDVLYSGEGDDVVDAGDGADLIIGGNGAGNDRYNGGAGIDTVRYTSATASITVNLTTGSASGTNIGKDTLVGIEYLIGGKGSDSLTGSTVANNINGDTGNDAIKGEAGNDTLIGGAGNDTLDGGAGVDSLVGGDGSDTYTVDSSSDKLVETNAAASTGGTDLVLSSLSAYTLGANVENGRIMATGTASLAGNTLNNLLYAGAGNNVVNGAAGTDTLSYLYAKAAVTLDLSKTTAQATGGSGSDTISNVENLTGSSFNDKLTGSSAANALNGAAGNDTLIGGTGKDSLTGGAGNDLFDFNALGELGLGATVRDVITDFTVGQDKIDLATIDANTSLAGDQAFKFVTSFTATTGQVRYSQGVVYLNTDSDAAAEYEIGLTGVVPASLTAASFVL